MLRREFFYSIREEGLLYSYYYGPVLWRLMKCMVKLTKVLICYRETSVTDNACKSIHEKCMAILTQCRRSIVCPHSSDENLENLVN